MKTALVTGASRGIGKQVALELGRKGYRVFLAARDKAALQAVKAEITRSGGLAEVIVMDLLSPENIASAVEVVKTSASGVDILANVAGMYHDDKQHFFDIPFEEYPDHAIVQNINATLVGHVLLTKHLVPLMHPGSSVISISGTFGQEETGVISDYLAKKGIELFAEQLALELKDRHIRSNCVRLGFVFTENVRKFFPEVKASDALDPVDVAKRIVGVAEDAKLNGQTVELTV